MCSSNPTSATLWNVTGFDAEAIGSFVRGFYALNWTPEAKEDFQNTILNGPTGTYCASVTSDVSCIDLHPTFKPLYFFYLTTVVILSYYNRILILLSMISCLVLLKWTAPMRLQTSVGGLNLYPAARGCQLTRHHLQRGLALKSSAVSL